MLFNGALEQLLFYILLSIQHSLIIKKKKNLNDLVTQSAQFTFYILHLYPIFTL